MAARYWRITGIETYGGGDLELSELQLFALDANNNPVRVDQTATLTSSVPPIAGTLSALNDGDTSTTARFPTGPGLAFVWDFGDGGGYDMMYVGIGAGQSADRFITSLVLQSSADGTSWNTAYRLGTFKFPGAGGFIQPDAALDQFYTNVTLLAPLDTRFNLTDASPYKKPITPYGGIAVSTANGKFGYGAAFFDGVDDYLTVPASQDFAFGTGDFTVEVWVYFMNASSRITNRTSGASYGCWSLNLNTTNIAFSEVIGGEPRVESSQPTPLNTWIHVAASRVNGTLRLFINGVMVGSGTFTNNFNNANYNLLIGRSAPNESEYFKGYMNDLRITKGVGRYTANFTPPTLPAGNPASVDNQWIIVDPITTRMAESYQILGADVPPFTTATASPPIAIDIIDGGTGRLTGTVREKTGISTRPLKRRVVLLDYRSNRKLRETVSDEQTGVYSFDEIDLNREYTVISLDHTGQYRAVIADKLVPEKML